MVGGKHGWGSLLAGLCALAVAAGFAAIALADGVSGPHEPNDSRKHATGPLQNDKNYVGAIERNYNPASGEPSDTDWFKMKSSGRKPLIVTYTSVQGSQGCFGPEARLLTKKGKLVGTAQPPRGQDEEITAHPKSSRKYYLRVRGYSIEPCAPDDSGYRLRVTGLKRP